MNVQWLQAQQQFHVHQKITLMINRYEVFADDGNGAPGQLVAFVEQKRMTFKEQVTLYTDPSRQQVLAGFRARKVIDLASAYDVVGPDGGQIGVFGKQFGKSLFRSTWQLDQPGQQPIVASERSMAMALFRRVWDFLPWVGDYPFPWKYHFDFTRNDTVVASVVKKTRFRDHYLVSTTDPAIDRRLLLAHAVALDALQSR